jgi:hypothetical protein
MFAGAAGLLTLVLRKNSARVRHWVWVAASVKFLVPFSFLVALGSHVHWRNAPLPRPTNFVIAMDQVGQPFTVLTIVSPSRAAMPIRTNLLSLALSVAWAIGFVGIAYSWWIRRRRITAAIRTGTLVELDPAIPAISSLSFMEPGVSGYFVPFCCCPKVSSII